jgi:hypothetical protein
MDVIFPVGIFELSQHDGLILATERLGRYIGYNVNCKIFLISTLNAKDPMVVAFKNQQLKRLE